MTKTLKGIAASDGIAVAPAYLLVEPDLTYTKTTISDVDSELARYKKAIEVSTAEVEQIRYSAKKILCEDESQVFEAHLMILNDPEFTGAIENEIKEQKINSEAALDETAQKFITIFEGMTDNAYMQQRAADVRDVSKRIMAHLIKKELTNPASIDH